MTDPGRVLEQARGKVSLREGLAMALYGKQVENMHKDAIKNAEKALDQDEVLRNHMFHDRQNGKWVLVQFHLLESDAPNSQGDRLFRFWNVSYKSAATPPQLSVADFKSPEEYRDFLVDRLKQARMPQYLSATWQRGSGRDGSIPAGWHMKSLDHTLLPPFNTTEQSGPVFGEAYDSNRIRGTMGRCTQ